MNYDGDKFGNFRAKTGNPLVKDAPIILDSTVTQVNTPFDMLEAKVIDEEEFDSTRKVCSLLYGKFH